MQIEQAKQIPLDRVLEKFGYTPDETRLNGNELWYKSPFRDEKTPSFKIDVRKNLWYDFGEATGGTVIDLVMKLNKTDAKGALGFLDGIFGKQKFTIKPKDHATNDLFEHKRSEPSREIFVLKEVKNFSASHSGNALWRYITQERCIDTVLTRQFLKEIHFSNAQTGKRYFAAGIENTEGGYEIRNPFFKGTVPEATKSISFVKTAEQNNKIVCFEGMLDFLSYGSLFGIKPSKDYLILNSVTYAKKAVEAIKKGNYEHVQTFFDNDLAGDKATAFFKSEFPSAEAQNSFYVANEDLNAFLMESKKNRINCGKI